jgi:hypothetical protein
LRRLFVPEKTPKGDRYMSPISMDGYNSGLMSAVSGDVKAADAAAKCESA